MKNTKIPRISFVICTLNCKDYLERCLKSIRKQDYDQNKVEIVVVDSYSTDGTLKVAKKYKSRIILTKVRGYMEGKGMPKAIGCEKAKGEIVITLDSDNALVENDWIKKMIYPLLTEKEIDYAICRMAIVKSDPLINQYLSLVGTDPFAIYASLDPQISLRNVNLTDKDKYFVYHNTQSVFLITGGYYLAFRKRTLKQIGGYTRDVDVAYSLACRKQGAKIAIAKNTHLHHLITTGAIDFFRKKMKWGVYYFNNKNKERSFNWNSGLFGKYGKLNFGLQILKTLSVLPALIESIQMYYRTKEKAWFLHAPLVFATTFIYVLAFFKTKIMPSKRK